MARISNQMLASCCDFIHTQRCTVCFMTAFFISRTFTNQSLTANDRRFSRFILGSLNSSTDFIGIVSVHICHHVPTIAFKALRNIFGKPTINFTVNGNIIIIIQNNQFTQSQCTRQRTSFMRYAFHQTAIAQENISMMIHNIQTILIEFGSKHFLCQRHTNRIGNALSQWPCGGFNTVRVAVLGVSCGFAVQLAEIFQIVFG